MNFRFSFRAGLPPPLASRGSHRPISGCASSYPLQGFALTRIVIPPRVSAHKDTIFYVKLGRASGCRDIRGFEKILEFLHRRFVVKQPVAVVSDAVSYAAREFAIVRETQGEGHDREF